MKTTHILFVALLAGGGCIAGEPDRMTEGRRVTAEAFALLSKNLAEAIARDGVPAAIGFCSEKAIPLTNSIGAKSSMTLRRVSHKARNPMNKADAAELEVIEAFRDTLKAGTAPEPKLSDHGDGSATFFAPIVIGNPVCLKCHGVPGTDINAETLAALRKVYPKDEATGFKSGELRGMWRVDFPNTPKNQTKKP